MDETPGEPPAPAALDTPFDARYRVEQRTDGSLSLWNPRQSFAARADEGGVMHIAARRSRSPLTLAGRDFALDVQTLAVGRDGETGVLSPSSLTLGSCLAADGGDPQDDCWRRMEWVRPGAVEWWTNSPRGLQQGWTIEERPAGAGHIAVRVAIDGMQAEVDREGTFALLTDGHARLRYSDLIAWDASGTRLRAWMELAPGGLKILVDDTNARYPVTIDPTLTTEPLELTSGGGAVAIGDVNGDGYDDLVVGNSSGNVVRVYFGSASGIASTPSWSMTGTGGFGMSVAAVDINDDGYAEVFVGAPTYSSPSLTADGALYFIPGQSDFENAPQPSAPWITGNVTNRYLGRSVASAGDVNGDAYDDLIIGANRTTNGSAGSVYLYLGSASGLTTALSSDVYPSDAAVLPAYAPHWYVLNFGDWFGVSVAHAGDIDADGYADIAVGGPRGQKAYVYYGKNLRNGTTGTFTTITGPSGRFGWSVAGAGDINQDGCDDLLVSEAVGSGTASQGYVSLFYGSHTGIASKSWTLADWGAHATPTSTYFGTGLLAGDFNADGYPDIAVGASSSDLGAANGGSLLLYLGSETGLPTEDCGLETCNIVPEPSWAYHGASSRTVGYSLAKGDLNGDGIPDVVAGTESGGRAHIFYGNTAAVAVADAISVDEGGTVTTLVGGATSVLDNDSDEDAQTLSAVLGSGPAHAASFALNQDGTFSYTHDGSETTSDSFSYVVHDGVAGSNTVEVTITITLVNDAPVITSSAGAAATEDTLYTYAAAATDPEGSALTWVLHQDDTCGGAIDSDGVYSFTPTGPVPPASCVVAISACDASDDCDSDSAVVTVTAVNDAPVITSSAGAAATEDTLYTYAAAANDPEGTALTWALHQDDTCGGAIDSSGVYTFTPTGPVPPASCVVAITVCDASDDCDSDSAVVTVTAVNDAPVITSNAGAVATEDTLYTYAAAATDPEGNALTWALHQDDTCGGSIDSSGVYTFTPTGPVPPASCVVAITVCDASDDCDSDSALVTITAVNDAPVITSNAGAAAIEDTLYTYAAAANDPEGTQLTWALHPDDTCGGSIDPSGVYSFIPTGPVPPSSCVVAISVCDASDACDSGSALVAVTGVNDAPVITSNAGAVATEDTLYTYAAAATDPEGNALTWALHQDDTCGGSIDSSGVYSFIPTGPVPPSSCVVAISVCDAGDACDSGSAVVTVTAVNDAPVITSNAGAVATEGTLYTFEAAAADPESGPLTWSLAEDDTCGGAVSATGVYAFTPTTPGSCTVGITVCDSEQLCDTVTAVVTIAAAPEEDPQEPSEEPQQPSEEPQQPSEEPQEPGEEPQQPEVRIRTIVDRDGGCAMATSTSSTPLPLYGLLVLGVLFARRRRAA